MFHFRSTSLHVFSLLVERRPEPNLVYLHVSTRQHSSRMRATHLPTVHVLVVTTRCQYQGGEYAFPAGPMSGGKGDCEYSPRGTHPPWVPPPPRTCDRDTQPLERAWNQRYPPPVDRQTPVKQECIPVGCVPSAAVAVSRGGRGVPGRGGVPGPRGEYLVPGGEYLVQGVYLVPGGCT